MTEFIDRDLEAIVCHYQFVVYFAASNIQFSLKRSRLVR